MHLRLSNQELATLAEMASLAANVASWNQKASTGTQLKAFETLESKIVEKAGHNGFSEWVEFDEERQCFQIRADTPKPLFFQECYEEFRNESFWDELAIRLSERDLARSLGNETWEQLSEEQRRSRTKDLEKRYWDEFSKRGVERIRLINPSNEG